MRHHMRANQRFEPLDFPAGVLMAGVTAMSLLVGLLFVIPDSISYFKHEMK